jgi:hypothetical protein
MGRGRKYRRLFGRRAACGQAGTGSHEIIALNRPFAASSNIRPTIPEPSRIARSAQMPSDKSVPPQLRFRRILRSTQIVASVTFILFSTLACAKESSSLLTSISGLWQFEDKNVWVLIDEKGVAYQCRIGREGTVFSASGVFVSPNSIEWQNIWGTETVIFTSGTMTLKGRFGEAEHHRASTPLSPACLPMRQRGGVAA